MARSTSQADLREGGEAAPPNPKPRSRKKAVAAQDASFPAPVPPSDNEPHPSDEHDAASVVQSRVDALLGPAAAASLPPVPNTPAVVSAFADALARLSAQCSAAGGTLLLLPSALAQDGSMALDLALAESPGFGPDRSTWPARSTIRVGKKSSAPLLALVLATAVTSASSQAEAHPIAALMEASGPTAVHIMLNAVCIAREKLQRQGLDCAVCLALATAPWMKPPAADTGLQAPSSASPQAASHDPDAPAPPPMDQILRLHILQRRLEAPVIDISEFTALQQQQGGRQRQDVASQTLAEVLVDLMERRSSVKLPTSSIGELALALKALAVAANMSSKARTGSYIAFVSNTQPPRPKQGPKPRAGRGAGGGGSVAEPKQTLGEGLSQGLVQGTFPLTLEVQRLCSPLRMTTMGPAEGRLSQNSVAEGLHKALATKLSSTGYWSCQVDSPQLIPWLMELVVTADEALRHRGTRLGIMPELFVVRAAAEEPAPRDSQGLLVHFLEYDPLVNDLLLPKPRRKELAISSSSQVAILSKVVALRNQRMGTRGKGMLLLQPYIDQQGVVRVALELTWLPSSAGAGDDVVGAGGSEELLAAGAAAATATAAHGTDQTEPSDTLDASAALPSAHTDTLESSAAIESTHPEDLDVETAELASRFGLGRTDDDAARPAPTRRPLKTLLVSKTSDPGMVARAVGWEMTKRGRWASASEPLVMLRMGTGDALVHGVTAIAMVQGRLAELGMRAVALPRQVLVEEDERRFTVVEWLVFGAYTDEEQQEGQEPGGAAEAPTAPLSERASAPV